jgi:HEAT repeat protein
VIAALLKALRDENGEVRRAAASSLVKFKLDQSSGEVIAEFFKTLPYKHKLVRRDAAESLVKLDQTSEVIALIKALLDKNEWVRYEAAESLAQLDQASDKVIDALIKALQDKNNWVRRAAADSLLDKLKIDDDKILKQVLIRLNRDLHDDLHDIDRYSYNEPEQTFESLRKHLNGRQIPGYRWKPLAKEGLFKRIG